MYQDQECAAILDKLAQSNKGIGAYRLRAMIGAHDILYSSNQSRANISFKFKHASHVNYCRILLNEYDTYTVEFYFGQKLKATHKDVFCEDLKELFEEVTGLALKL